MDFEYRVTSSRPFDDVVADVERLSVAHSFRVLHVHDVQATLAERGFSREPLKIIEICNARFADEALRKDVRVSLFMPCKINVYVDGGQTMITVMRPSAIAEVLPEAGLAVLAGEVDRVVVDIADRAARGE